MSNQLTAEPLFFDGGDVLGEGPYWDPERAALLWSDIMDSELHRVDAQGNGHAVTRTDRKVHAIARSAEQPWYLCTCHGYGLAWLNADNGKLVPLVNPEPDLPDNLLNDARCDPSGRFWFGSIHKRHDPSGSLYSFDANRKLIRHATGFGASNGIAFSPDGRYLYLADTYTGLYRFVLEEGQPARPELILKADDGYGLPDGLTTDTDGCLWVAMALSAQVARLTPEGKVDRLLKVPATFVTSCTFGGPDLDVLYITTARAGRPPEELAREPHAGALFAAHVGHQGSAEVRYAGVPDADGRSTQ
jgi:sugar lactone lactonase YvrE